MLVGELARGQLRSCARECSWDSQRAPRFRAGTAMGPCHARLIGQTGRSPESSAGNKGRADTTKRSIPPSVGRGVSAKPQLNMADYAGDAAVPAPSSATDIAAAQAGWRMRVASTMTRGAAALAAGDMRALERLFDELEGWDDPQRAYQTRCRLAERVLAYRRSRPTPGCRRSRRRPSACSTRSPARRRSRCCSTDRRPALRADRVGRRRGAVPRRHPARPRPCPTPPRTSSMRSSASAARRPGRAAPSARCCARWASAPGPSPGAPGRGRG